MKHFAATLAGWALLAGLFFAVVPLPAQSFTLTYESAVPVTRAPGKSALNELSGLSLETDNNRLWFVSDGFKNIYNMNTSGVVNENAKISIGTNQMEGVTYVASGPSGEPYLFTVHEDDASIYQISADGSHQSEHKLSDMANWDAVKNCFGNDNNGLEGITYYHHGSFAESHFFLVKESAPGLIIKIDSGLTTILNAKCLNGDSCPSGCACSSPPFNQSGIDFSGICQDSVNNCFWVLSDDGQRLLMYNYDNNLVLASQPLSTPSGDIVNAEGIAVGGGKVYIVNDQENSATLYTYTLTVNPAGTP